MIQHEPTIASTPLIANMMLVHVDRYAQDCQQILASEWRILNGYVMTFAHDSAIVEYENLGLVSFVFVFNVPIPTMSCELQVLWFFKVQTSGEGSFRVSADVYKLHLPHTSRFDPHAPLTSIGIGRHPRCSRYEP
jgi:hypothetical protein